MSECANGINLSGGNFSDLFENFNKQIMVEITPEVLGGWEELPWLWAMFGSVLIGLSGVLPLFIIPIDETNNLKNGGK